MGSASGAGGQVYRWAGLLAGWSVFVWGNRISNLVADDASAGEWAVSGTLSAVSLVLAAVAAGVVVRGWRTGWPVPTRSARTALATLAWWSIGVWVVRGVDIAVDARSVGFVAVHLVLAAVSIGLGAALLRALGRTTATDATRGAGTALAR